MRYPYLAKLIMLLTIVFLTACVATKHVNYDTKAEEIPGINRTVQFELKDDFFRTAPNCVTVLAIRPKDNIYTKTHRMVETAIARHMSEHISKVINPFERENFIRKMALDLTHPVDRKAYVRNIKCKYFLELTPISQGNSYLVFWSQSTLGLEARLTNSDGKITLWKARHVATRSDGGLPLSPISAVYNAFSAGVLTADSDIPYSLADDLARRLTATLPDIRQTAQFTIYN